MQRILSHPSAFNVSKVLVCVRLAISGRCSEPSFLQQKIPFVQETWQHSGCTRPDRSARCLALRLDSGVHNESTTVDCVILKPILRRDHVSMPGTVTEVICGKK
jgi:hypothetical protein